MLRRQRRPTVLVTHDVLDAVVLADRVLVLLDGRVVEQGPTRDVLSRPREPFTARLAGLNLLPGTADEDGLVFDGTPLRGRTAEPLTTGDPAAAVFAPAAVAVHRDRPGGSPRNALAVRLSSLEPRGDVVRVRGAVGDRSLAADVTPAAVADLRLEPGEEVWFAVKAAEVAIHPLFGGSSGA
ncbi:TOBE domain-containing protein [Saccharopolyspora cebuensis]|uniref:TOBE domain-containing protein n=1 Tax=Saccharopolyspora cebuensis TaxID=418759 RepID=UPI003CD07EB7